MYFSNLLLYFNYFDALTYKSIDTTIVYRDSHGRTGEPAVGPTVSFDVGLIDECTIELVIDGTALEVIDEFELKITAGILLGMAVTVSAIVRATVGITEAMMLGLTSDILGITVGSMLGT